MYLMVAPTVFDPFVEALSKHDVGFVIMKTEPEQDLRLTIVIVVPAINQAQV